MIEVVNLFVVGYWVVVRKMVDRYVFKYILNVVIVVSEEVDKQLKEVYEYFLLMFFKEGDFIFDIGSGNGKKNVFIVQ